MLYTFALLSNICALVFAASSYQQHPAAKPLRRAGSINAKIYSAEARFFLFRRGQMWLVSDLNVITAFLFTGGHLLSQQDKSLVGGLRAMWREV